jgi:hypothetical protein
VQAAIGARYALERELGPGGMATIYLGRDLRHRRHVAIKVLHPELSAALGPERFLREIELTASLQHPHILPLFDSGSAAGLLYYVMPFVEGETLRARLERERQLPVDDALRLAREVADALGYAHARGVVHRDNRIRRIHRRIHACRVRRRAYWRRCSRVSGTCSSRWRTRQAFLVCTPAFTTASTCWRDWHLGALLPPSPWRRTSTQ